MEKFIHSSTRAHSMEVMTAEQEKEKNLIFILFSER